MYQKPFISFLESLRTPKNHSILEAIHQGYKVLTESKEYYINDTSKSEVDKFTDVLKNRPPMVANFIYKHYLTDKVKIENPEITELFLKEVGLDLGDPFGKSTIPNCFPYNFIPVQLKKEHPEYITMIEDDILQYFKDISSRYDTTRKTKNKYEYADEKETYKFYERLPEDFRKLSPRIAHFAFKRDHKNWEYIPDNIKKNPIIQKEKEDWDNHSEWFSKRYDEASDRLAEKRQQAKQQAREKKALEKSASKSGGMIFTKTSPISGKNNTFILPVTYAQIQEWMSGTSIQVAMPNLTPPQREFLMTGYTPEEWEMENIPLDSLPETDDPDKF